MTWPDVATIFIVCMFFLVLASMLINFYKDRNHS